MPKEKLNTIRGGNAMAYTNLGLAKHAKAALALKTKYMWGGILRSITQPYINTLMKYYGNTSGTGYTVKRWEELSRLAGKGYFGCDCVGLIKSYYWSGKDDGGTGSPNYGKAGYPDVNAGLMYNAAKVKGSIASMPEVPGIIVYCKTHPHVGVYIGNGEVIESTLSSRGDGVVKTKLKDFKWEYWFECPYINYIKTEAQTKVKISVGAKVKIKKTAQYYASTGKKIEIPDIVKGKKFTVMSVSGTKSLIKEIYSWVNNSDLELL